MRLEDLPDDDRCLNCGAELPSDGHLWRRKYCCRACCLEHYRTLAAQRRAERKAGRTCPCGYPMPEGRAVHAIYCSHECKVKSDNDLRAAERERARAGRACAWCGGAIPDHKRAGTITCCRACTVHLSNARAKRARKAG